MGSSGTDDSHLREVQISRADLCRGKLLHVVSDTVQLPGGALATREYVIHPGAVMVVPLLVDASGQTRVVLERQFRYPVKRVMIEFPAGKLDPGEACLACAQRELAEETGYQARAWAHAGVVHPLIAYSTEFIDIWFARDLIAGARHLDEGEFLDVFTATPDELMAWCRTGVVTDGKTLTAALWLDQFLRGLWPLDWFEPSA
ncbi:MAG: NUDIX hydrolase [Rhodoferax sp.]|nr:NUDIX hydrolase [Rhodoferax sp.]PIW08678.1 MAG: ADP-ribose pyrophosphatase [Comamonadaceae bacterium CG17_big_fil_post_rev_8_21_14_2_50_60_13]